MNSITCETPGTYLNVSSASCSASRRTSRPRATVAFPSPIAHEAPVPHSWNRRLSFELKTVTLSPLPLFSRSTTPAIGTF